MEVACISKTERRCDSGAVLQRQFSQRGGRWNSAHTEYFRNYCIECQPASLLPRKNAHGATHYRPTALKDVSVNLNRGRAHIPKPYQFLDRLDILALLLPLGCKAVVQSLLAGMPVDSGNNEAPCETPSGAHLT